MLQLRRTRRPPPVVEPHKLYVVGRRDLPPGLRTAQIGHAVAEVVLRYPAVAELWNNTDNYLIVLEVPNEAKLRSLVTLAKNLTIPTATFLEPDLDLQMTAAAFLPPPYLNWYFARLDLAYRGSKVSQFMRWMDKR